MAKLIRPSVTLLKFRIFIYSLALLHLVIMSTTLLNIDFESSKDKKLHAYSKLKWRLITTWFNLLTLGYIPICLYCDWRELRGEGSSVHLKIFNQFRSFCFSSLILPSTAFADILFWRLWNKNRELMVPASCDEFISIWAQHCMHTVSLVFVIFDLVCVCRKRPRNLLPGVVVLNIFNSVYVYVCVESFLNGEYVYPLLETLPTYELALLVAYFYVSTLFYYTGQWFVIDLVHGKIEITKMF